MTEKPKTLRERAIDHAVSAGFARIRVTRDLNSKEEGQGGFRPYHHERSDGHYVDIGKEENDMMRIAVSEERGVETVYMWPRGN